MRSQQPQYRGNRKVRLGARAGLLILALLVGLGSTKSVLGAPSFGYPWPDYSVLPILFSPTDWQVDDAAVRAQADALGVAMLEIQEFYRQSLDGRTFRLNPLEVVQGWGPKEEYGIHWNGGNIYTDGIDIESNLEHAVVSELHARGYPTPPAQNESGYSVIIFVKGAGGWAGGRELGAADGGWAILGDWCVDSISGLVPEGDYWWSGRRLQLGAAAHELGHTFGLPHPDAYHGEWSTTVMGHWWDYPNVGFNSWEIDYLLANKAAFLTPEPASWLLVLSAVPVLVSRLKRRGRGQ